MMNLDQAVLLARTRLLALRALVRSGGQPTPGQLLRAVEPLLGDLLPLPTGAAASDLERELWAGRLPSLERVAVALSFEGAASVGSARGRTVVSRPGLAR